MSNQTTTSTNKAKKIPNINVFLDELFQILSEREQKVVTYRFALTGERRETLAKIGERLNVTRERIRQIETCILRKLRRTIVNTKLQSLNLVARNFLKQAGDVQTESQLISQVLSYIKSSSNLDGNIIRLALAVDPEIKQERINDFETFWHHREIFLTDITLIANEAAKILKHQKNVTDEFKFTNLIRSSLANTGKNFKLELIKSVLTVDKRFKKVTEGWGLMSWRNINPRSLRDKALIIFRKEQKPLHFIEVTNLVASGGFDKKMVTVQAIHNELIRDPNFVLIGRGTYALREWGYTEGTVLDIIEELLTKKGPLPKEEIVRYVLKQRQVKKSTILLNLQKIPWLTKTGRALFKFDPKLKKGPEAYKQRRGGKKA